MAHYDIGREAFVLQFTQNLGNGGATRDAIGIVAGQWDVRADVPQVEVVGSDWYNLRPVVAGRHQGKEFMPRLLLQRRCDLEKLPGKILMQEQYPHFFSFAVPQLPQGWYQPSRKPPNARGTRWLSQTILAIAPQAQRRITPSIRCIEQQRSRL
jgi:hypothetical protein